VRNKFLVPPVILILIFQREIPCRFATSTPPLGWRRQQGKAGSGFDSIGIGSIRSILLLGGWAARRACPRSVGLRVARWGRFRFALCFVLVSCVAAQPKEASCPCCCWHNQMQRCLLCVSFHIYKIVLENNTLPLQNSASLALTFSAFIQIQKQNSHLYVQ
jgi:hypothetical protein